MNHDFDIAALSYDLDFTQSNIGRIQRQQVYKHLNSLILSKDSLHILELNCGTGEDANYMSKLGHHVLATDISAEMIRLSKEKYNQDKITFKQLDINHIDSETFDQKFDLIFSNFGGLNCLSPKNIDYFLETAPQLLSEKGKLALVIMPKSTLWERIYFTLKGESEKSKRRKSESFVLADVNGVKVKTWYYNPSEISKSSDVLKISKLKPIGLWVPPSYLEHSFLGKKVVLNILKILDSLFSGSFLSKYADHFYIELEKSTPIK